MNVNLLLALNKEYTIQLTNILSPLIYEGLQSIYQESINSSTNESLILKNFQIILRTIKDWTEPRIKKELSRIYTKTNTSYPYFIKLIQAVFKTSQLILDLDVSYELINDINVGSFIHYVYIECARMFWMDPFLFYHLYSPYEVNCNLNIIMAKIGTSIENANRRLLPMGIILDKFIGSKSIDMKNITISEIYCMPLLLEQIPYNIQTTPIQATNNQANANNQPTNVQPTNVQPTNVQPTNIQPTNVQPTNVQPTNIQPTNVQPTNVQPTNVQPTNVQPTNVQPTNVQPTNVQPTNVQPTNVQAIMVADTKPDETKPDETKPDETKPIVETKPIAPDETNSDNKQLYNSTNNKILKLLNNKDLKLSESPNYSKQFLRESYNKKGHSDNDIMSTLKKLNDSKASIQSTNIESKIKHNILKNLDSETYKPEMNIENYQDIFSNSEIKRDTVEKISKNNNNTNNTNNKNKQKFFNNYLNI